MPQLLRIHFSSVGHRDARLAPLTIDLRGADGRPSDSVVWLRNGGGKSSVLNLFFAVFRPNRRDFLGTSHEGRSRRIEDYVQSRDFAIVVTEWTLPTPGGRTLSLFGDEAQVGATRLVGQALCWSGQQRSQDVTKLKQLYFSICTDAELTLEDLPVSGLGEPVATLEAFADWLRDAQRRRPARELVVEYQHNRWTEHLEAIGLDPELFGYQVKMNQREGAADELFRFGSSSRFIEFFL